MVINNRFIKNTEVVTNQQVQALKPAASKMGLDFNAMLKEQVLLHQEVKFSKHAEVRLNERNIKLSDIQRAKISQALDRASSKGIKDTLVIMDNMAFVANVKSRTVITAINNSELQGNVFTNIDGAVFA